MLNKIEIAKDTFWIGKIDDRKVPFHRLILEKGTTYNSYFLNTDKPTIIDTVDIAYAKEYIENVESIIDLKNLQYLVVNHVEPDHAGAVGGVMAKAKNATIVTTEKGKEFLIGMFKLKNAKFLVIKDGDTLDIGGKTLKFFETPFLHTEETMISYSIEDKILFPCDIFSTHIANFELFNDLAKEDMTDDFMGYYSLIMHPHRPYVRDMLSKIAEIEINMIAPSHGYILRENPQKYISLYDELSNVEADSSSKKALILFSSMTGNSLKIAQFISQGLNMMNVETNILNIKNADRSSIDSLVDESDIVLIGSSTKYGDMIGDLEAILKEITKLDLSRKYGAAFGSYGWSGEAIEIINDYLKKSNINLIDTSFLIKATGDDSVKFPLRINFTPEADSANLCIRAGKVLGELLN